MFGVARDTCWSLSAKGAGRGQVYMGLDYYDENNEPLCGALRETVARFERVVVDYAGKYPTGAACFKALELPATFEPVASVVLELEGNRWPDLSGSWLPTGLTARVLYVLTHRNARALAERRRRASAFSNPQVHLTPPQPRPPNVQSNRKPAPPGAACGFLAAIARVHTFRRCNVAPQEYSGAGAAVGDAAARAAAVQEVMERAGEEVGQGEFEEQEVRGWSLNGLRERTDAVGGGAGTGAAAEGRRGQDAASEEPAGLPAVPDNWNACAERAKRREMAAAEEYWARLLRERRAAGREPHVSQFFEFAVAHLSAHAHARAAELFGQVVRLEPRDPRGYNNLALALENTGDLAGARAALRAGLEHAPGHNGLNYNLGKLLLDEDAFQAAAAHLERAALADPANPDIHFYLGTALRRIPERAHHAELAYAVVEKIDPRYVFRYINTDTNDQYWEFVADEQAILANLTGGGPPPPNGRACDTNLCRLRAIVSELRALEATLAFVGDRQLDGRKAQLRTGPAPPPSQPPRGRLS